MHWFKIVLVIFVAIAIVSGLYEAGKGNYQKESKSRAQFIGAILDGLLLWGILVYL